MNKKAAMMQEKAEGEPAPMHSKAEEKGGDDMGMGGDKGHRARMKKAMAGHESVKGIPWAGSCK